MQRAVKTGRMDLRMALYGRRSGSLSHPPADFDSIICRSHARASYGRSREARRNDFRPSR